MLNTITVEELIKQLQQFEKSDLVVISQPTGDHWYNTKTGEIENIDYAYAQKSSYHNGYVLVDDKSEYEEDKLTKVVLLE